jgi:hypothetical protein
MRPAQRPPASPARLSAAGSAVGLLAALPRLGLQRVAAATLGGRHCVVAAATASSPQQAPPAGGNVAGARWRADGGVPPPVSLTRREAPPSGGVRIRSKQRDRSPPRRSRDPGGSSGSDGDDGDRAARSEAPLPAAVASTEDAAWSQLVELLQATAIDGEALSTALRRAAEMRLASLARADSGRPPPRGGGATLAAATARVDEMMMSMTGPQLATACWGLAALGAVPSAGWVAAAGEALTAQQGQLRLPQQAEALWSLATWRWPGARNFGYHLVGGTGRALAAAAVPEPRRGERLATPTAAR